MQLRNTNALFQKLITLHIRLTLLVAAYSITGYAHARQAAHLLQSSTLEILEEMGRLHRVCIWENILLKGGLVAKGLGGTGGVGTTSQSVEDVNAMALAAGVGAEVASAVAAAAGATSSAELSAQTATEFSTPAVEKKKVGGPKEKNVKALKHLDSQLPNVLTPFFQGKFRHSSLWI